MSILRYDARIRVLVVAGGHPYARDALMAAFDGMEDAACTLVEQPAASLLMTPEAMADFDAMVLYDMPGIDFRVADPPRYVAPSPSLRDNFVRLLDAGKGIVALHHAIAGWPAWDDYAEWLGGRFLYRAGPLRHTLRQDSGYRHDVTHEIAIVAPDHPITAGLPARFTLTDELYLSEVFEDDVIPLLRSGHAFRRDNFYSAAQAVAGRMYSNEGWAHADGPDLVGWVKRARRSPLVYLQPGDGPATFADAHYRRLLANAIRWAASPEALAWARHEHQGESR